MGKYSSKDEPPIYLSWTKKTKAVETSATPSTFVHADSPSKLVGVNTQLIMQLTKWHEIVLFSTTFQQLKRYIIIGPQKGIRSF